MLKNLFITLILGVIVIWIGAGLLLTIAGIDNANGYQAFPGLVMIVLGFRVLDSLKK